MPHFILDCSKEVLEMVSPSVLLEEIHQTAVASGLFEEADIKVRINPFTHYFDGGKEGDFLHVFGNIMEGRTDVQKSALSKEIVTTLKRLLPDVPILSMNIRDFKKGGYCNKSMIP